MISWCLGGETMNKPPAGRPPRTPFSGICAGSPGCERNSSRCAAVRPCSCPSRTRRTFTRGFLTGLSWRTGFGALADIQVAEGRIRVQMPARSAGVYTLKSAP